MITVKGFNAAEIQALVNGLNVPSVKKYYIYDADGDVTDIYYAQSSASAGEKCLHQQFTYTTTVSGNKVLQKEAWNNFTWSGSVWDI